MRTIELVIALKKGKLMGDTKALESTLSRINYNRLGAEGQFEIRNKLKQLFDETRIDIEA